MVAPLGKRHGADMATMEMDGSALPWLDEPVMLHSSRADTCKLTAAQCEYRSGHWRYWYQADHVYALNTVYFMCAVIGIFAIANILSRLSKRSRRAPPGNGNPLSNRVLAISRLLAYKQFHVRGLSWYSAPLGVILLGLCGVVYFFGMTLGPQPYYWPNTGKTSFGGSPPLATRAGWMALALLPFVIILASKANYITLLTSISHEKLQVYHRWTSWTMFVLALVHTFPFIIVHIQKGDMMMMWKTEVTYWTGVAALIPQTWLNVMSIGWIRNRYYEFFKATHFLAIGFFVFFFFIHCDFRLTSWDYFIAVLTLYSASLAFNFIRTSLNSLSTEASFTILPDSTLRITIPTTGSSSRHLKWTPGQHVFLRFWALGMHAMSTHPFTICSLQESGEMVFFVRPTKGGFTGTLKRLVEKEGERGVMAMSVDGPYGHANLASDLSRMEKVILIAGGSGAGFLLPILETLARGGESELLVVIAVRCRDSASWIIDEVESIFSRCVSTERVRVEIHVTDEDRLLPPLHSDTDISSTASSCTPSDLEKSASGKVEALLHGVVVIQGNGRPDLKNSIRRVVDRASGMGVGVTACGPASMMLDVRNECAAAQGRILSGNGGVREVYLHTEAFGW